jgi:hypothetical protein
VVTEYEECANDVLVAHGGDAGGYSFHMDNGRLRFAYNYGGRDLFELETKEAVGPGRHALRFEFEPTGPPDIAVGKGTPGRAELYVEGVLVAVTEFPQTTPLTFELEGLSCGYDVGAPTTDSYEPPFPFTGTIHSVTYDLSGDLTPDDCRAGAADGRTMITIQQSTEE